MAIPSKALSTPTKPVYANETLRMRAALAAVQPTKKETAEVGWIDGTAKAIGAVPSATVGFFATAIASFQYHEAIRTGAITEEE